MHRRTLLTSAALAAAPAFAQSRAPRRRPNILFLMTDQQRGDCLGADGNRAIHTPNLDRLAAEGVRFRHAYSSTPTCTPARTALLTGLSPWHHGMLGMTNMARRYPLEMPQALRDAGYFTTAIGKMHFFPMRNGHGFHRMILDEHCGCGNVLDPAVAQRRAMEDRSDYEAWFYSQAPNLDPHATGLGWNDHRGKAFALPEALHPTTWTAQTALNFLNTYNQPEPFFLKVSFIRPHSPYDPPERFLRRYADANLPAAAVGDWAARYQPRNTPRADLWHGQLDDQTIRRSRQAYYGCVSQVDEQIGRILDALTRRGMLEDTLILFTSDHGDMTGDHHLWRKSYAYQASSRIPMLLRWPSGLVPAKRGAVLDHPVELRDVLPTFLDVAGHSPSQPLDGESLLKPLRQPSAPWRPFIDLEHDVCYSPANHWNALTDGQWKYIYHALDGEEQLFHLTQDPHELRNLSGSPTHSATLSLWRQRLVDHFAERGAPFLVSGRLQPRPTGMITSPNFPKAPPA